MRHGSRFRLLLLLRLRLRRLDMRPIFVLLPGSMTLTTVFTGAPSAEEVEGGSHRTLLERGVKQCPISRIYGPLLRWGPYGR
eukprot:scaffold124780_cov58-Phaeocystis_antarctica.AAC.2